MTNAFSFIFPLIVLRLFGLRTAIVAGLFPTYLVYTTVGYSDAIALTLLALALFFFLRGRFLFSGIALSLAGIVSYNLLIAGTAFVVYMLLFQRNRSVRAYLGLVVSLLLTGISILFAYLIFTGNAFTFFTLERTLWGVKPTTPIGRIDWLIFGKGVGSLNSGYWGILGLSFTGYFWVLRNIAFEMFFFTRVYLLARLKDPNRWLLIIFSSVMTIPLLFVDGTPAYSIPPLMLAAFPIFFGYSKTAFAKNRTLCVYVFVSIVVSSFVVLSYVYAFFA